MGLGVRKPSGGRVIMVKRTYIQNQGFPDGSGFWSVICVYGFGGWSEETVGG